MAREIIFEGRFEYPNHKLGPIEKLKAVKKALSNICIIYVERGNSWEAFAETDIRLIKQGQIINVTLRNGVMSHLVIGRML